MAGLWEHQSEAAERQSRQSGPAFQRAQLLAPFVIGVNELLSQYVELLAALREAFAQLQETSRTAQKQDWSAEQRELADLHRKLSRGFEKAADLIDTALEEGCKVQGLEAFHWLGANSRAFPPSRLEARPRPGCRRQINVNVTRSPWCTHGAAPPTG